jgi:hypothetical protein
VSQTLGASKHSEEVAREIMEGRCVAFVGAGFSAAAGLPGWQKLLRVASEKLSQTDSVFGVIRRTLDKNKPSSRELEAAAQLLEDALGGKTFREAIAVALQVNKGLRPDFLQRRSTLLEIPFRAILTTNFDLLLQGATPTPDAYRRLLREGWGGPWDPRYWPEVSRPNGAKASAAMRPPGSPIVQLHGRIDSEKLVFSGRDYRRHLFSDSSYLTFLKALFATRTVLFMGFSFRDAYLNLLRSELLQLLDTDSRDQTEDAPALSYAILPDVSEAEALYLKRHEGLRVLSYKVGLNGGEEDHSGFDDILGDLAKRTNPIHKLAGRLAGARVLWMDPQPENNVLARELMGDSENPQPYREVRSLEEAREALKAPSTWDLVLTHWGYRQGQRSNAQRLLEWMHQAGVRSPVVVFCSPDRWVEEKRREALRWGAADLTTDWSELFQAVDRVLPNK